jgi:hypothetical protein
MSDLVIRARKEAEAYMTPFTPTIGRTSRTAS